MKYQPLVIGLNQPAIDLPCSHILAAAGPWPSWKVPRNSERDPGWTSSAPVPMTGTKLVSMAVIGWQNDGFITQRKESLWKWTYTIAVHHSTTTNLFTNAYLLLRVSCDQEQYYCYISIFENHDSYFYDPLFTEAILLPAKAFRLPDPEPSFCPPIALR